MLLQTSAANAASAMFGSFPASSALFDARQATACGLPALAPQNAVSASSAAVAAAAAVAAVVAVAAGFCSI